MIRNLLVYRGFNESQLQVSVRNETRYLNGPLIANLRKNRFTGNDLYCTATFLEKFPSYTRVQQGPIYIVVGASNGAVLLPYNATDASRIGIAYTNFCGVYAEKLGLFPGKARLIQFHSFRGEA